jgi:hypothetical protein
MIKILREKGNRKGRIERLRVFKEAKRTVDVAQLGKTVKVGVLCFEIIFKV